MTWIKSNLKPLAHVVGAVVAFVLTIYVPGSYPDLTTWLQIGVTLVGAVAVAFQSNLAHNIYAKSIVSGVALLLNLVIANLHNGGIDRAGLMAIIGGLVALFGTYQLSDPNTPTKAEVLQAVEGSDGTFSVPNADGPDNSFEPPPAASLPSVEGDAPEPRVDAEPSGEQPDDSDLPQVAVSDLDATEESEQNPAT